MARGTDPRAFHSRLALPDTLPDQWRCGGNPHHRAHEPDIRHIAGPFADVHQSMELPTAHNASSLRRPSRVNDHRLKAGGFRLRLKAGSVRHAADLQRQHRRQSLLVQRCSPEDPRPLMGKLSQAHECFSSPMLAKTVGFPDPLSGTLKSL